MFLAMFLGKNYFLVFHSTEKIIKYLLDAKNHNYDYWLIVLGCHSGSP